MDTSKAAAALGRKGGKAGTGASKRRGDSAYYRALVAARKDRAAQEQASRRCDNGCALWCAREIGHDSPCAR